MPPSLPALLAEPATWQGCLISSTSRLLLPVDELRVCREGERWSADDRDGDISLRFAPGGLPRQLADMVVRASSVDLVPRVGKRARVDEGLPRGDATAAVV